MHRRKIGIIVTLAVVVLLGSALAIVYNYVNTVIPYYDVDDTEYHIKQVNGIYVMCRKNGDLLDVEPEFNYYITDVGTMLQLDAETGEIKEKIIPDFYDPTLSETVDHEKILIFPYLSSEYISAIKIYNEYEPEGYTLMRYNLDTLLADDESDFVLMYKNMESTLLDLEEEKVAALYVGAGYALASGKIDPEEVAKHGYAEYGLEEEVRTRKSWAYKVVFTTEDKKEITYYVNMADGKLLDEEVVKDAIEPTYDMSLPTKGITIAKAVTLAENDLRYEGKKRIDCTLVVYDETYTHVPSYYMIAGTDEKTGEKVSYKMIIGDRLINGGGYYAQYVDIATGERRPTVYTLGATIENTLLAPAKHLVIPGIAYPTTAQNYYDVEDFTINRNSGETGVYNELITFSFVDILDRENTVEGIHPYIFSKGEFKGFRPNHDNIDRCLLALMDPTINEITVLSPSAADKIAYGIASPMVDENGNTVYDVDGNIKCVYDAKYKLTFYRTEKDEDGKENKFLQTMYISEPNYEGNYYVYTLIDFPAAKMSLDIICEVSSSSLNFLIWDEYDWVYPSVLQTGIIYTEEITVELPDYSVDFDLSHSKEEDNNIIAVHTEDSKGNNFDTFSILKFQDKNNYTWIVTAADFKVYDTDGNERKPSSRRYEDNSIGDQVRVLDQQILANDGRRIRIMADTIEIIYPDDRETEVILRHHTTIFKKLFSKVIGISLVDSIDITPEEEAALIADPKNFAGRITLTDNEGGVQTVELYKLTARKTYIVVNGSGGFYISSKYVEDLAKNIDLFIAGKDIEDYGK